MLNDLKLVVFDMAGTTLKDEHEVEKCFALAAKQTGLDVTDEEILSAQGWSKIVVFEKFWEKQIGARNSTWENAVLKSFNAFKEILENYYRTEHVQPTEGCLEVFDFLKKHDIAIALTTGFYRQVGDIILNRLGWLEGLDAQRKGTKDTIIQLSITSDEVEKGRPAPDMIFKAMNLLGVEHTNQVVKIGDTPSDLKAGKAAGCRLTLGVTNGTHTKEQLQKHPHDMLVDNLAGMIPILTEERERV